MDGETRYTIDDLTALTGFSRRTIRFYVEKGLVEAPAGRGKGGFYGESQLSSLRRIAEAKRDGRSLAFLARETIPGAGMPPRPESAGPVSMLRWKLAPGVYLDATSEAAALHGGLLAALLKTAGIEETVGKGLAMSPARGGTHARTGDE